MKESKLITARKKNLMKRAFAALGPGLVTGAADDDPSGIATYSVTGAQFGTMFLWVAWITWPLMAATQMMCARIAMMSGNGIGSALSKKFPRPILYFVCIFLLIANVINIGADLAGMADAAQVLTGANSVYYVVMFGLGIAFAIVKLSYDRIANVLKWLAFTLFSYVITAFLVHGDWGKIAHQTIVPTLPKNNAGWQMLVALLGTTISPYLFFWQASQEVEEIKEKEKRTSVPYTTATKKQLVTRMADVSAGTFLSNMVMFFIILTTALTLHANGQTNIETSKQAAEALKPLAGNLAMMLYTLGIVSLGFLSIPTLAGSSAYAFAESFKWKMGLSKKLREAYMFYTVIIISVLVGIGLNFLGINPVKALVWSAIINGILAPFLMVGIIIVARDKKIMNNKPSSRLNLIAVSITTLIMFAAAGAMIFL